MTEPKDPEWLAREQAAAEVLSELAYATHRYPKFHSAHEGWAVLREEVDELWEEVRKRPQAREKVKMRDEAVQVAAMAIRFMLDCTEPEE